MEFFQNVWDFCVKSYWVSQAERERRVAAGEEPNWPLVTFNSMFVLNVGYLIITFVLIQIMKRREAIPDSIMKPFMALYNLSCVILAGYVVYGIAYVKWIQPGTFACNRNDTSPLGMYMNKVIWVFFVQKFWEFMDTWIFILRKSFRQVTILHIYHHASINIVIGYLMHYEFNADLYLPVVLNAFVHVLMYSHYLVSSLGFKTWWNKYLTSMQLIQFLLIMGQNSYALYLGEECGTNTFTKLVMIGYMITMLIMFTNFFVQRYVFGSGKESSKAKANGHKANGKEKSS